MSALGELASGVAHDFNNTLAGILGRAQLVARTSDPEKIRKGLQIIIKTAEDGARTVKRIQDFARQRRSHDFEPVATDQLLLDAKEMTRPRWKDSAEARDAYVSVALDVGSNSVVMGDESELREVLVNMICNAVDAMPQGGTLTLASRDEGEHVLLSVSDTGCGMTQEVRSRIFDPFFTTKGKAGMGLGLAVSYGIVRRHDGAVEVQTEVNGGTTLTIRLPVARGVLKPEPAEEVAADAHAPAAGRARVLVVDDEQHVRDLLADILETEGCEAVTCASGNEALAIFGAGGFDAVFTDIGMPGMSGWELARIVRERDAGIPVAVITGWGESVGSEQQQAARVDWVVSKPFSMKRIVEILREVEQRNRSAAPREEAARDGELAAA
jgi:CheY-like chemotaxis protein